MMDFLSLSKAANKYSNLFSYNSAHITKAKRAKILATIYWVLTTTIILQILLYLNLILQMTKLRFRVIIYYVQGHTGK